MHLKISSTQIGTNFVQGEILNMLTPQLLAVSRDKETKDGSLSPAFKFVSKIQIMLRISNTKSTIHV